MANKKKEDPPKGSPAWMATFSDLMNLLLCFFVLLFSMSSVDAEKFQEVAAVIIQKREMCGDNDGVCVNSAVLCDGFRFAQGLDRGIFVDGQIPCDTV